jgi:hypothetical protein
MSEAVTLCAPRYAFHRSTAPDFDVRELLESRLSLRLRLPKLHVLRVRREVLLLRAALRLLRLLPRERFPLWSFRPAWSVAPLVECALGSDLGLERLLLPLRCPLSGDLPTEALPMRELVRTCGEFVESSSDESGKGTVRACPAEPRLLEPYDAFWPSFAVSAPSAVTAPKASAEAPGLVVMPTSSTVAASPER